MISTSDVSSMYVIFVLTPRGHMICNLSLFSCNKNTINTNSALNMKNAKTDLFLNSIKSRAMRSYLFFFWFGVFSKVLDFEKFECFFLWGSRKLVYFAVSIVVNCATYRQIVFDFLFVCKKAFKWKKKKIKTNVSKV